MLAARNKISEGVSHKSVSKNVQSSRHRFESFCLNAEAGCQDMLTCPPVGKTVPSGVRDPMISLHSDAAVRIFQ